jgi:hypothetical protein
MEVAEKMSKERKLRGYKEDFPLGAYLYILMAEITLKRRYIFTSLNGVTSDKSVNVYSLSSALFSTTDG